MSHNAQFHEKRHKQPSDVKKIVVFVTDVNSTRN